MRCAFVLVLLCSAACSDESDPCEGVTCPPDRTCIALEHGAECACLDPAVEVDGVCVEEGGEGE